MSYDKKMYGKKRQLITLSLYTIILRVTIFLCFREYCLKMLLFSLCACTRHDQHIQQREHKNIKNGFVSLKEFRQENICI